MSAETQPVTAASALSFLIRWGPFSGITSCICHVLQLARFWFGFKRASCHRHLLLLLIPPERLAFRCGGIWWAVRCLMTWTLWRLRRQSRRPWGPTGSKVQLTSTLSGILTSSPSASWTHSVQATFQSPTFLVVLFFPFSFFHRPILKLLTVPLF